MCWCVYFQIMNVFVLQLMCVLMQSQVYSMMTTAARKKSYVETKVCEVEQIPPEPSLPVLLLDIAIIELGQDEDALVLVDKIASADAIMVLRPCFSQTEANSQGERILNSLLRLKILFQGTTYTVSERRRC